MPATVSDTSVVSAEILCKQCPPVSNKLLLCTAGVLAWEDEAWYNWEETPPHAIDETTEVHRCFNDEACVFPDGDDRSRVACDTAKGYYGPLCGACDRDTGFIRSGYGCQRCLKMLYSYLGSAALVLAFLVMVGWFTIAQDFDRPAHDYSGVVLKMFFSHLQMLGVLGIFKARGTAVFNEVVNRPAEIVGGSITSITAVKCTLNSQAYGTFLMNMFAPFAILAVAGVFMMPAKFIDACIKTRRIGKTAPSYKGMGGLPRIFVPFTCMRRAMTMSDTKAWSTPIDSVPRLVAVLVFTLFTLYPTLVSSIAKIVNCSNPIGGKSFLLADMTVTCYETWHLAYLLLAAICFIVYCCGIPVVVFAVSTLKSPIVCVRRFVCCTRVHPSSSAPPPAMLLRDTAAAHALTHSPLPPPPRCFAFSCRREKTTTWVPPGENSDTDGVQDDNDTDAAVMGVALTDRSTETLQPIASPQVFAEEAGVVKEYAEAEATEAADLSSRLEMATHAAVGGAEASDGEADTGGAPTAEPTAEGASRASLGRPTRSPLATLESPRHHAGGATSPPKASPPDTTLLGDSTDGIDDEGDEAAPGGPTWWWIKRRLVIGRSVYHLSEGHGVIIDINPNGSNRVHIAFAGGDVHRYSEAAWKTRMGWRRLQCFATKHHAYFPPQCRCRRRPQGDYFRASVRRRYGFLFHGYQPDGSAIVVGWEATVMLRKLLVTLAGAGLSDPYLQIIAALMILIASFGMQVC